jgi:hypothetical protein
MLFHVLRDVLWTLNPPRRRNRRGSNSRYRAIRKSNWHNPTCISQARARARKGIHEALRARHWILSVTNTRWLLAMCTETDSRFVMHIDFELPEGHNPVIGELITK